MIFWLIVLGIAVVSVGVVMATGIYTRRIDSKVADTADWLESEATIQNAAIERLDKYTWYPGFAFSYPVRDEYFSGKFFLKANEKEADELLSEVLHRKFSVQYDPDNPSEWYIAESSMDGYEIIQKLSCEYPPDDVLYRSDGDQPLDLHLDR